MLTFAQSLDTIARLVKQYRANHDAYRAPAYREADARQDLIDPLFVALGWDVHNTLGAKPDYKLVVVEENRRAAANQRAPDYTFRMSRADRKFFVEAKKPGVNLRASADAVFQNQIDAIDHAIDALVYELYGLTEEEIRIVEGG